MKQVRNDIGVLVYMGWINVMVWYYALRSW